MKDKVVCVDIETNGLLDNLDTIHCIVAKQVGKGKVYRFGDNEFCDYPLSKFHKFLKTADTIVLHNGIGFDLPAINRVLGLDYSIGYVETQAQDIPLDIVNGNEVFIYDSLIYSKLLNPDRLGGHSLKEWGSRLGEWKGDFNPKNYKDSEGNPYTWNNIPVSKDMVDYCVQDVIVTENLYLALEREAGEWEWAKSFNLEKAVAKIIQEQEEYGFYFDQELARKNVDFLNKELLDIEGRVEPLLPERPLNVGETKFYTPPANQIKKTVIQAPKSQFLKNGTFSNALVKFAGKIGGTLDASSRTLTDAKGKVYPLPLDVEKPFKTLLERSRYITGFVERVGAEWVSKSTFKFEEKEFKLPIALEPIKTSLPIRLADQKDIKAHLVSIGWEPTVFKEKDLTVNTKKLKLDTEKFLAAAERYATETVGSPFEPFRREAIKNGDTPDLFDVLKDHYRVKGRKKYGEKWQRERDSRQFALKVLTMPAYTVDADKTLCPNLLKLGEKVEYVQEIVNWLTYRHRRNSILSPKGGGFLAHPRLKVDGRLPTPADTLGCNCLTADSLVVTDKGCVPIVDVHVGDLVLTHEGRYKPVVDRITNGIKDIYKVSSTNGLVLKSTGNHPYLTEGGWVDAKDLKVGDKVYHYKESFKLCEISSIETEEAQPTFDVTVEEDHSYVANGFVVHNTGRFQHKVVANIPRVTSLFGEPMRSMFCVPDGYWQIGCDADALEARIEGHNAYEYTGGEEHATALIAAKPNDIHSVRARALGISRDDAKTVGYALLYGAQAPKLAKQMAISLTEATKIFTAFWDNAPALKEYKSVLLDVWGANDKKYIVGPDGRKLMTRSAHSILNTIFQHSGVLAMKRAMVYWDKWVREEGLNSRQLIAYHDEAQVEAPESEVKLKRFNTKEEAEAFKAKFEAANDEYLSNVRELGGKFIVARSKAGDLQVKSILRGGEFYNYNVPLTSGWDLGKNWADCH